MRPLREVDAPALPGARATSAGSSATVRLSAAWLLVLAVVLSACARQPSATGPDSAVPARSAGGERGAGPSASDGLVYVLPDSENWRRTDLWRARLSDGAIQPLIETPDRGEEEPAWSERAGALVFEGRSIERYRTTHRLVLWRAGREVELPGERKWSDPRVTWAPLAARFVYAVRSLPAPGPGDPILNGIALFDVETRAQAVVASGGRDERYVQPAFSPDGRRMVATYRTRRPRASRLVVFEDGAEPQILTGDEWRASQGTFTRDGNRIVFSRRLARTDPRDLAWMRPDGSELEVLMSLPESEESAPAASPTRDEIAFLSNRDGKLDLFVAHLPDGPPRNLTAGLGVSVRRLGWSPDGEHLAITTYPYDPETGQVGLLRPNRATAEVLVIDREGRLLFRTRGLSPDWMPPWG